MEPTPLLAAQRRAAARVRNGANWFFWIAGLSVVNTAISLFKGDWHFLIGLGVTQVSDALAGELLAGNPAGRGMAVAASAAFAGIFVLFGASANRRRLWAFIAGGVLYLLDGLLFLLVPDFLSVGFHVFALFWIALGMLNIGKWKQVEAEIAAGRAAPPDSSTLGQLDRGRPET